MEPVPKDERVGYPAFMGPCCKLRVNPQSEAYWQPRACSSHKVASKSLSSSGVVGLNTTICHILKPCSAQAENLEVQLSETCQKRFVMFDHSGSGRKIILHPTMASELPKLFPSFLNKQGKFLDHLQDVSSRAVNQLKESMISSFPLPIGAGSSVRLGWGDWSSGEEISSSLGEKSIAFTGGKDAPLLSGKEVAHSDISHKICSPEAHEDSDDIEALLSSDNEMCSTGDGPSNITWNSYLARCRQGCLSDGRDKKRNCPSSLCCTEEEDDADSAMAMSGNPFKKLTDQPLEASPGGLVMMGLPNQGLESGYGKEKLWSFSSSCVPHHASSSCSSKKQMRCSNRARKQKMKSTFHVLPGVLPGRESRGTAIVLDEPM